MTKLEETQSKEIKTSSWFYARFACCTLLELGLNSGCKSLVELINISFFYFIIFFKLTLQYMKLILVSLSIYITFISIGNFVCILYA